LVRKDPKGKRMILDPALFAAYLVAATALALSPGPDTMFVLASSASGGSRAGIAATFGIGSGGLVHAALAAVGISALIAASPEAFDALRIAGAFYLAWMALSAFRAFVAGLRGHAAVSPGTGENVSWIAYRRGLATNLLNPKVIVFYIAFLPQFASPALGQVPLQMFLLGVVHIVIGVLWLGGLAIISGRTAQAMAKNPRVRAWLDGAAGTVYILLALRMLFLERRAA
jgi:threonine/homoserine/homoserine lactone efflux protein